MENIIYFIVGHAFYFKYRNGRRLVIDISKNVIEIIEILFNEILQFWICDLSLELIT